MCFGGTGYRELPEAQHIPLLEAILASLEDFEWYNALGSDRKLRQTHVWALLFALIRIDENLISSNDSVVNMIIKSWPTVIKWLRILTEDTNDDEVIILSKRSRRSWGIMQLLLTLVSASKKTRFLWKEEVTTSFAFRFWTQSNQDFTATSIASVIITHSILSGDLSRLEIISNWSIHHIMDLVVSRIRDAAKFTPREPLLVEQRISLLDTITMIIETHPLLPSLWIALDATSALIDIVRSSVSCRKTIPSSDVARQVSLVKCCFHALDKALVSFSGRQCREAINMALRGGLLEVSLLLSAHVTVDLESDEERDFPLLFLLVYLPPFLTYSACIQACVRATERLGPLELNTLGKGHRAYMGAWIDLQRLLCARLASSAYFRFNPPFYQCSNVSPVPSCEISLY